MLRKRETLRQLVQSLQLRLSPDLQYDLQQGAIPPAPMMPQTAGDAEVLNPAAVTSDADLLQTGSQQCVTNEQKSADEAEDNESGPVLHSVPERDETDAASQLVTVNTAGSSDGAVDASMPAADETSSSSVAVCQGTPVSTCTAAATLAQDASDNRVDFEHLISEPNCNALAADAGHLTLSADVAGVTDEQCIASSSSSSLCQDHADAASRVVDSVTRGTLPCVNESLMPSYAELEKSAHEHSDNDSAHS